MTYKKFRDATILSKCMETARNNIDIIESSNYENISGKGVLSIDFSNINRRLTFRLDSVDYDDIMFICSYLVGFYENKMEELQDAFNDL